MEINVLNGDNSKRYGEGNMPKVSVLIPSLNVGKYIEKCIKSVVNQTLNDIEIICIDAGSTDNTLEILHKYAAKDPRIKIVMSDIKSYGYQMNLGLDNSTGEYIGIVEADDFAELNMFENLCNIADKENAEIVRANYYWHTSKPKKQDVFFENLAKCPYNQLFSPEENRVFFTVTPSIWSAIYKKELISKFNIRFNETPGASYQDTSFHFSVATMAERVFLVKDPYIHYRKDNDNSSVNSKGKVYCVSDEMHYYEEFLGKYPEKKKKLLPYFIALKYEKYRWNYERLAPEYQYEFLELMYKEFLESRKSGLLDESNFENTAWNNLQRILENPRAYFNETGKICSTQFNSLEKKDFNIVRKASYRSAKISIIIPVYNSETFICQTLDSVLAQTLYDIEIICINDGSSDSSLDILLEYAKQDHRITVISQINKGLSSARNAGLEIARGEYVYFLDSDDMLEPNSLEELYMLAHERDVDVLYFDGKPFYESEELKKKYSSYETAYKLKTNLPDILTGQEIFCKMIESNSYRCSSCLQLIHRNYLERI
ncbi:MAG: glycosyltransferase, partial [Dehalobacterium sp.]